MIALLTGLSCPERKALHTRAAFAVARSRRVLVAATWLLVSALGVGGAAHAEKADRSQPLQFDAAQMRIDGKRRTQVLTGNVLLTQGTMTIKAHQVELRETPQGQVAVAEAGGGVALVQFRQKRDGADEWIEGQALRIEYDGASQTVKLLQRAQVRMLRAGVLSDQVEGELIVYDQVRDTFDVSGSVAGSAPGRVRGSVTPRAAAASGVAP